MTARRRSSVDELVTDGRLRLQRADRDMLEKSIESARQDVTAASVMEATSLGWTEASRS